MTPIPPVGVSGSLPPSNAEPPLRFQFAVELDESGNRQWVVTHNLDGKSLDRYEHTGTVFEAVEKSFRFTKTIDGKKVNQEIHFSNRSMVENWARECASMMTRVVHNLAFDESHVRRWMKDNNINQIQLSLYPADLPVREIVGEADLFYTVKLNGQKKVFHHRRESTPVELEEPIKMPKRPLLIETTVSLGNPQSDAYKDRLRAMTHVTRYPTWGAEWLTTPVGTIIEP